MDSFMNISRKLFPSAAVLAVLSAGGCARVAVEGGDKPIHIVMDINVRVARELDQFFAFEEKQAASQPATVPSEPAAVPAGATVRPNDVKPDEINP